MARPLSTIFKSTKPHILKPPKPSNFESNLKVPSSSSCSTSRKSDANSQQSYPELLTSPASNSTEFSNSKKKKSLWCVYLILSTNPPIKTYVGVTTNFCRRLKEHNGELKGGAKASRSGRPWICACLIRGFKGRSEACAFESKWKQISRKLPRKRKSSTEEQEPEDNGSLALLQHRHAALDRVQSLIDCSDLNIDWRSNFL
ncbi:structure-specific endonuclease subunit slx1 [Solanum lycopersicum]|uniref:structure-specific endonuclease subunit slx1 n=1 Tax=Solanum lycopersicum TaxID=4081 RepID=UPI000276358A|nr:structure-specific endonuclease subunit slx1 [Solanum lycopersicum]